MKPWLTIALYVLLVVMPKAQNTIKNMGLTIALFIFMCKVFVHGSKANESGNLTV
jgi:hypothetical protein